MTRIFRFHVEGQEEDWWVQPHQLVPAEGRLRRLRPIHVLTYFAQALVRSEGRLRNRIISFCRALENKLFGVRFFQLELKRALASVEEPIYATEYSRESDQDQVTMCVLEAYLNAIYTSLELTAKINQILHTRENLPLGFRKQSKRFQPFSFDNCDWLGPFYDLRTELAHYSSAMFNLSEGKLVIEFTQNKNLHAFKRAKHGIPLEPILVFCPALFEFLDSWAVAELQNVDPEVEVASIKETGLHTMAKMETVKAREILDLLDLTPDP